jgi:hypothetical protein
VGKRYLLCIIPASLSQPRGGESTASWLSNCGFGGFQINLRAPTINLARMDPTCPKITFGVVGERLILCIRSADLAATDGKGIYDSLAIELRIWFVSKQFTSSNNQPGSIMAASQSKNNIWCGRRTSPSLYYPFWAYHNREERNWQHLAYGIVGLLGFRNHLQLSRINNQPG